MQHHKSTCLLGPYLGIYIKAPQKKPSMEQKLLEAGKDCRLQIGKLKAAFAISWPVKWMCAVCFNSIEKVFSTYVVILKPPKKSLAWNSNGQKLARIAGCKWARLHLQFVG